MEHLEPNMLSDLHFVKERIPLVHVVIGCDGGKSVVANILNLKPLKTFSLCGVRDERIWEDPEAIRRSSLEFISDYPQDVIEMIKNADPKSLSFERLRYRSPWDLLTGTFYKGRVIVAGDAMHVMGTFMGQGGSTGLEEAVVLARNMAQFGFNRLESGRRVMVHGVEQAFNLFVKQRRMRIFQLSLQIYLTGMLLGASSRLKKVICIVLLSIMFSNMSGHTDYDCGDL
ncbi:FAD/NAD(P)-binding domain protein [Artemisia annua]|uniref:FAD/NAD(P)-binding domain protein n=1 Tax=Artemisia annua TaxID=35608 RepID=A0A2U1MH56_ARTAN|nr:FAD/NAD(P)-binding domain protein [Artemisia annua]